VDRDLERRARLHAVLGEPLRLAIVDRLATSDASPTDLAVELEIGTNLLAHHLDALQGVGLIERVASHGDRRRRYIRLHRDPLADLGITTRAPGPALFVCTHNSARSQLAAALWTARTGQPASSAGTHPADRVHPKAVAAARRAGLDLGEAAPRVLEPDETAEVVVTVCDRAREELHADPSWWHWSLPDPAAIGTARAFDATVADLDRRIHAITAS
jgi:protein-tyrosine-phosphatase